MTKSTDGLITVWRCSSPQWRANFMVVHPIDEVKDVLHQLKLPPCPELLKALREPIKPC